MPLRRRKIELSIESRQQGTWTVVSLKGEVDVYTAPRVREEIGNQVKAGNYRIVIDLSGVDFMDSTGLAVLVSSLKRVKDHDGALALATLRDPVRKVFSLTGLDKLFPVYATVEEATKS